MLHKQATRAQEAARPAQNGQVTLPPVDVDTSKRAKQPKGEKQVAKRAPPIVAPPPPPKVETATGPVRGYLASQSGTGTKTNTPLRETPQSITVGHRRPCHRSGRATVQETLRYVPGVFADAYGPDSRGDYPRIRGQDPYIYLDGTRVVNTFQFNEWRPDPYTLERIEVLRGP